MKKMNSHRITKLSLHRESIRDLTPAVLGDVVGGQEPQSARSECGSCGPLWPSGTTHCK